MAFPHFGHPYGGASQFLVSANSSATCCDSSPRSVPDVASGSTPAAAAALCLAPYESRLLGSARPELGTALGIYGAPYAAAAATQSYPGYLPYSPEPPALYGALNAQYEFKESAGSFTPSLPQPGAYYPYEPTLGHCPYDRYHAASELSGAGRRKNATRETTSTLKAWLHEHRKNPYPTKGEKIMLAIVTKMTLTQVSTWFANARRRLKKENKMTWAPKSRGGEERRAEEGAAKEPPLGCCLRGHPKALAAAESREARGLLRLSDLEDLEEEGEEEEEEEEEEEDEEEAEVAAMDRLAEFHEDAQAPPRAPCAAGSRRPEPRFSLPAPPGSSAGEADFLRAEPVAPALATRLPCSPKPRIWSLAHTATARAAVEGAPPGPPAPPEPRSPPECRLVPRRPPVLRDSAPDQPCRGARASGKPALSMPAPPPVCAPCPRRREAAGQCQYPSGAEAG